MVTKAYTMNPSLSDGEGSRGNNEEQGVLSHPNMKKKQPQYKEEYRGDNLTSAGGGGSSGSIAASSAAALDDTTQARSPPSVHYTPPLSHIDESISQTYDGDDYNDDEGNERDDSLGSTDQQHFGQPHRHQYSYEQQQQQQPQSPMVTPPTRAYQHLNATGTTESTAVRRIRLKNQRTTTSNADGGSESPTYPTAAGVPHVYHDHSQAPDDNTFIRKKTGGVTQPFPEKLQEMLRAVDGSDLSEIVSWLPHGRAFLVRKPKEFTDIIMPKYFKQTKLTSFQRQLNLYGFRRLTQGTDAGAYYHEMFLKSRPGLCQRMSRQKVKGTGHKQPADAKTEPNFYEMRPADPNAYAATTTGSVSVAHDFGGGGAAMLYHPEPQHQEQPPLYAPVQDLFQQADELPTLMELGTTSTSGATEADRGSSSMGSRLGSYPSPGWTLRQPPPGSILDSPASPGLHGAAHLLQNIASGYTNTSALQMPNESALLGPPAMAAIGSATSQASAKGDNDAGPGDDPSSSSKASESLQPRRSNTSFLQPRLSSPFDFDKR